MPKPKTTNLYIHCRVTQTISAGLQQAAKDHETNVSVIMRQAFEEYLQSRGYRTADV
jgi:predicted transcriptional regulator